MSSPTQDEIQTQISQVVWIFENNLLALKSNTPNFEGEYEEYGLTDLKGDHAPIGLAAMDRFRALMSSTVAPESLREILAPHWRDYAKLNSYPETDPDEILERLLVTFAEGSERVLQRTFVFGAASMGGGNTGDGTINRLTVDRYAFDLENATTEVKKFRCTADRNSGTNVHQELFEVRGTDVPRDFVAGVVSRDRSGDIAALSADDSLDIISNPSFNLFSGTAPNIDSITNWTVTTNITSFQIETSDVYRTSVHEGTAPGSVRFETNDKLTQDLSVVRPTLDPLTPYYVQIAFKRENSCDGNLTLRVGVNSATVALVAQSGWTLLKFALDEKLFLRGFNATTLDIEIEMDSRTTGTLLVDDLIFAPMFRFDGTYFAIVGGAIPFLVEDVATVTDTIASDSILQKWLWRAYGRYLPHDTTASANVTWLDPS